MLFLSIGFNCLQMFLGIHGIQFFFILLIVRIEGFGLIQLFIFFLEFSVCQLDLRCRRLGIAVINLLMRLQCLLNHLLLILGLLLHKIPGSAGTLTLYFAIIGLYLFSIRAFICPAVIIRNTGPDIAAVGINLVFQHGSAGHSVRKDIGLVILIQITNLYSAAISIRNILIRAQNLHHATAVATFHSKAADGIATTFTHGNGQEQCRIQIIRRSCRFDGLCILALVPVELLALAMGRIGKSGIFCHVDVPIDIKCITMICIIMRRYPGTAACSVIACTVFVNHDNMSRRIAFTVIGNGDIPRFGNIPGPGRMECRTCILCPVICIRA